VPKVRHDWEAEYTDPESEAEDAELQALAEELDGEIMREIDLCRQMEEDEEFARKVFEEARREREEQLGELLLDEDYEYWSAHQ
jgi:hypothetical protein